MGRGIRIAATVNSQQLTILQLVISQTNQILCQHHLFPSRYLRSGNYGI